MSEGTLVLAFSGSFLVGLSGAVPPGPLLALDVRESSRLGFLAGPYVATGHSLVELALVLLLLVGLGPIFRPPSATAAIGIVGGAVLLWMAWRTGHHPLSGAPALTLGAGGAARAAGGPIIAGALVTLANPYWFLWWATVGTTLMSRSYALGSLGISAFYLGHIAADYSWYSLVSLLVAAGRKRMTPFINGGLMLLCAAFLAAAGGYFLVTAVWTLV